MKVYLNYPFFFKFSYLVAKMGVGHRHGDTYLYHFLVIKIRSPRVPGYMPPSVPLVVA